MESGFHTKKNQSVKLYVINKTLIPTLIQLTSVITEHSNNNNYSNKNKKVTYLHKQHISIFKDLI